MAAEMLVRLASAENVSLFRKDFVVAQDVNDAKKKDLDEDCSDVDDNDAKKKHSDADSDEDCSDADDADDNDARKHDSDEDDSDADDMSLALDTAVASLLSASAALDAVGFEKSASLSLKLASFVLEAKKKSDAKKKSKKDSKKSDKKDSKKSDSNAAKDKKSDSKKSDSKKSDSKKSDGKKPNPFAKKK